MGQSSIPAQSGNIASIRSQGWKLVAHHILSSAIDLVFPPVCVGCNRVGTLLCKHCISSFNLCFETQPPPTHLSDLIALGMFEGSLREAVHALKYDKMVALAEVLGALLANRIQEAAWPRALIVPVPLHHRREAMRGFNQSALLGRAIADQLGWPCKDSLLQRTRETASQVDLSFVRRQENVRNAFTVNRPPLSQASNVILVDDVYTTGATINECAATLLDAGVQSVRAVVIGQAGFAGTG